MQPKDQEKPSNDRQSLPQKSPDSESLMDAVLEQELGIPIGTFRQQFRCSITSSSQSPHRPRR
jgi:hypothetical protein